MAIIKKYNKSNGTTYVYESESYWDKDKKQPRSKRKLIGKLDPVTGEIVPTGTRGRKPSAGIRLAVEAHLDETPEKVGNAPADSEKPIDYQGLYQDARKLLLEKEARLAELERAVSRLQDEKCRLIGKLEQAIQEYRR